jgi:hypothetical protein
MASGRCNALIKKEKNFLAGSFPITGKTKIGLDVKVK